MKTQTIIRKFVPLALLYVPLLSATSWAAIVNKVENGSFYTATGGVLHEWEKCNPDVNDIPDGSASVPGPTVSCASYTGYTDPGTVSQQSQSGLLCSVSPDNKYARITPDSGENVAIRQRFFTDEIIGRVLTVNVCLRRPLGIGNRTATVTIAWKTERDGATYGVYAKCVSDAFAPGSTFAQETFYCEVPDPTFDEELHIYSDSFIQIETGGTSGSLDVDAVQVLGSDVGPVWTIDCINDIHCRSETLPSVTSSDEIATVSSRDGVTGTDNFPIREVYVTDATGGNAKRITTQPSSHKYGQMHAAVSPDRSKIAVVRFEEDWDGNGKHTTTVDPQAVWILDTGNDVAYQLTPYWQDAGLAGVAWDSDSTHLYYSVDRGRHTWIYRINLSTFAITKMTDSGIDVWEAEVDLSRDDEWLIFGAKQRFVDGTYEKKQRIYRMEVDDAPCSACASREQLTDIDETPKDAPAGVGFPVGDYDPQFSPDGTEILFWRNRECLIGESCDVASQGWSIEKCSLSDDCTDDANVDRLLDGGVGENADVGYLIPDWGNPTYLPNGVRPIIVGTWDTGVSDPYVGIYALEADGTSQLKTQQGKGYTDDCEGDVASNECDLWPRFIDR